VGSLWRAWLRARGREEPSDRDARPGSAGVEAAAPRSRGDGRRRAHPRAVAGTSGSGARGRAPALRWGNIEKGRRNELSEMAFGSPRGLWQKQDVHSAAERCVESPEQLCSGSDLKFKPTN